MTTTQTNAKAAAAQLVAAPDTDQLLEMLAIAGAQLDSATTLKDRQEYRIIMQFIYDELETRHPTTIAILEQWIENDDDDRPYWQMMIDATNTATNS